MQGFIERNRVIEFHIRSVLQPWFNKLGNLCSTKVTPNNITTLALVTGLCAGLAISIKMPLLGLGLVWFSGLCDVMDGTLARLCNNSQKIGAYFDLIADRMVEAAIILGFAIAYPQHYLAYICFLIAVLLHFSTFLAASALFANTGAKSMHYDHSYVERAEAFIVFTLMLLLPNYIFAFLTVFNCIVFTDGLHRFYRVVRLS